MDTNKHICADCLDWMLSQPDDSVDLVFGSPPYEDSRTYGIDFNLKGQDWVDWLFPRVLEMVRISNGLVALVIEGKQRKFRYSATPILLMADLHRAGINLKKPAVFHRIGIPGSGSPDWLRNNWEFIMCCTSGGRLPWSDNTAMGHDPKFPLGGYLTYRDKEGRRFNQGFKQPKKANPGNVIHCKVGGGHMGHPIAHENEAPFPESLAEFFIRSFCPPTGVVLDPFGGSGTTAAVAHKTGREWINIDIRASEIEKSKRRIASLLQKT